MIAINKTTKKQSLNNVTSYINNLDYSKTSIKELVTLKKVIASNKNYDYKNRNRLFNYIDNIIDTIRYKTLNLYN